MDGEQDAVQTQWVDVPTGRVLLQAELVKDETGSNRTYWKWHVVSQIDYTNGVLTLPDKFQDEMAYQK